MILTKFINHINMLIKIRRRDKRYKRIIKQRERTACGAAYWKYLLDFFIK